MESVEVTGGYKIQVFSKDGRKIKEIEKCSGDLILANFFALLESLLSSGGTNSGGIGYANIQDINGTVYEVTQIDIEKSSAEAPSGDDTYGILVGSGTTQPQISDFSLSNKISNSTLSYGSSQFSNFGTGSNMRPGISRKFTNNGNNNVQVNEIGLVIKMAITTKSGNSATINVMVMRDVINSISVPPGGILNVEYYFNLNPSS